MLRVQTAPVRETGAVFFCKGMPHPGVLGQFVVLAEKSRFPTGMEEQRFPAIRTEPRSVAGTRAYAQLGLVHSAVMSWLLTIVYSYLLGSIPFGYIFVRVFRNEDVRTSGSGNIGATNVARGGKGLGIATLFFDALKGWLAVMLTHRVVHLFQLGSPKAAMDLAALAGLFVVLGHMFPVWLGFRGGKGVATALGVFIALSWPAALGAVIVFVVAVALTRYVSVGSIAAAIALPILVWLLTPHRTAFFMLCTILIAALVVLKHHSNIARLRAGTESKLLR